MTQNSINGLLALGVVAAIAVGSFLLGFGSHVQPEPQQAQQTLGGGLYNALPTWFGNGLSAGNSEQLSISSAGALTVGSSGTALTQVLKGSCSLIAPSYSVTASTTIAADCAVSGVVSGDLVVAKLATSTAASLGWQIVGSSASTTANYITVRLANMTGVTGIVPASLASSTQYLIIR